MIIKHITLIGCLALSLIACDKIGNKNSRSSGGGSEAAPADPAVSEGDATAAQDEAGQNPDGTPVDPAMALTGKDLYAKLCAGCHQDFEESTLGKTSMGRLKAAIEKEPDMAGLKDLSEADLEALVAALSELPPGKGKKADKKDEENEEAEVEAE
ncbi:c-type cytochrome [Oligoflexus tunisiensis]|uniref:c-type cytochrome n=1 Tax=Oligoflexus tunisiensis TaxID=708132 RepID=UPI00114C97A6|nr:cytochrome c [Oligoflexus tunisiensis]